MKEADEEIIRRRELIPDPESLKNHGKELKKTNKGKPGPRYRTTNRRIQPPSAARHL